MFAFFPKTFFLYLLFVFFSLSCKREQRSPSASQNGNYTTIYRNQAAEERSDDLQKKKLDEPEISQVISAQNTIDGNHENNSDWNLVWSDEFEEGDLDLQKWSYEQNCWGGGNGELQCYTDKKDNVYVKNGFLNITAIKESFTGSDGANGDGGPKTMEYTSGRIRTKGQADFLYGKICARAKLPYGQGLWPAIWMLPTDPVQGVWAASGEIDIMEAVNLSADSAQNASVHGTLHYGGSWPDNVHSGQEYVFEKFHPGFTFHEYCVEWEEGEIRWFIDDEHYATQNKWYSKTQSNGQITLHEFPKPFDKEFHILLNVAVGGAWPGPPDAQSSFPQTMSIDWVRVYECLKDSQTGKGCKKPTNIEPLEGASVPDVPLLYPLQDVEELIVYGDDGVDDDFEILTYGSEGINIIAQEVQDTERGEVIEVKKGGRGIANVYAHFVDGFFADFSTWSEGQLVMDLQVNSVNPSVRIKIDSGWPQTSDLIVDNISSGVWKTLRIPIQDLFDNDNSVEPGSKLNPSYVVNPIVIEPVEEGAWSVKIDQVRVEKI